MQLKSLFITMALAATTLVTAQTKQGFSADAFVGVNFNKLHADPTIQSTISPEAHWHGDLRLGVDVHYTFKTPFVISSGLAFTQKTFNLNGDVYGRSIREGRFENLNYLQLPLTVGYQFQVGAFTLRPWVGVTLNYGLGGNAIYTRSYTHTTASGSEDIVVKRPAFSSSYAKPPYTNHLERLDFAYNFGIHAQYKRYGVKIGYEHGFAELNTEYTNAYSRSIVIALTHRLF